MRVQFPSGSSEDYTSIVHTISILIIFPHNNEGRTQLLNDYDQEELQDIANHGCQSGVCNQHIYYADTISFFDKYEDEIYSELEECFGVDTLVEIFKRSDACYDMYRNECCWLFIENIAQDAVIEMEESQLAEDQLIESYMQPVDNYKADYTLADELTEAAVGLMSLSGVNPPNSMNLHRYSNG